MNQLLLIYKIFTAVNLHFTTAYDFFKYKGRVPNITESSLYANSRRIALVNRLSKRCKNQKELIHYCVAQHVYSSDSNTIYDPMLSEENYDKWVKFSIASTHTIEDELRNLNIKEVTTGDNPEIFKLILDNTISIQTAAVLNTIQPFLKDYYFTFNDLAIKINKLKHFISYDKDYIRRVLFNHETV